MGARKDAADDGDEERKRKRRRTTAATTTIRKYDRREYKYITATAKENSNQMNVG